MAKKILILSVLLVILIIYTISTFNYKKVLESDNSTVVKDENKKEELVETIFNKVDEIKKSVNVALNEESQEEEKIINNNFINLELIKDDNQIFFNGILRDEKQVLKLEDLLGVTIKGDYKFNPAINVNEELLVKISQLMIPSKDLLTDNSKLLVNGDEISLIGELKDLKYKDSLISIINKVGLEVDISNLSVKKIDKKESLDNKTGLEKASKNFEANEKLNNQINSHEKMKELQSEINNVLSTNKITFERRSTKITKDSFDSVKKIADILNDNINIKVEIGGHTDSRGAASLNKRISQDRANSVMNALIDLGIEKSRLTAVGYGEDFPIAKDDKNGLSEVNRRVEIKVLGE